jgi:predicted ABC-type ATPase
MAEKLLYIVGGPNGAGKTTLIRRILRSTAIEYLSADFIAAELSPHDVASAQFEAGREFVRRQHPDRINSVAEVTSPSDRASASSWLPSRDEVSIH